MHASQDNNASVCSANYQAKVITHLQRRTPRILSFLFPVSCSQRRGSEKRKKERKSRALTFIIDYDDGEHVVLSKHGEVCSWRLAETHSRPKCPVHLHTLTHKLGTRSHAKQMTELPFCTPFFLFTLFLLGFIQHFAPNTCTGSVIVVKTAPALSV